MDRSRRRFLIRLAAGSGLIASGLSACAAAITFRTRLLDERVVLSHNELEELFRVGDIVLLAAEGLPEAIVLIRKNAGSYRALGARCTHLGCRVRPGKHALICPCHGSVFDLEGKVIRGPAQEPLPGYALEVKETAVEILVSRY